MTRDTFGACVALTWAILMVLWLAHTVIFRVVEWVQERAIVPLTSWA